MPNILSRLELAANTNPAEALKLLPELFRAVHEGMIVELPCKVGDMVYVVSTCENVRMSRDDDYCTGTGATECPFENQCNHEDCDDGNKQIFETTFTDIWYGEQNNKQMEMFIDHLEMTVSVKDIGKTVFLTREAAEERLESEKL